jgi:hypothetical protein
MAPARTTTPGTVAEALLAVLDLGDSRTCPTNHVGSVCPMLARHGRYSGLAAGRVRVDGEPRPTARRIPGPLPSVLRVS